MAAAAHQDEEVTSEMLDALLKETKIALTDSSPSPAQNSQKVPMMSSQSSPPPPSSTPQQPTATIAQPLFSTYDPSLQEGITSALGQQADEVLYERRAPNPRSLPPLTPSSSNAAGRKLPGLSPALGSPSHNFRGGSSSGLPSPVSSPEANNAGSASQSPSAAASAEKPSKKKKKKHRALSEEDWLEAQLRQEQLEEERIKREYRQLFGSAALGVQPQSSSTVASSSSLGAAHHHNAGNTTSSGGGGADIEEGRRVADLLAVPAQLLPCAKIGTEAAEGLGPRPRHGHTLTRVDDKLYLFGGIVGVGGTGGGGALRHVSSVVPSNELFVYTFAAKEWSPAPVSYGELPQGRTGHSAVCFEGSSFEGSFLSSTAASAGGGGGGDALVVFGGTNAAGIFLDDVCIYRPSAQSFSPKATVGSHLPAGRSGHSAVSCRQRMFVFGGRMEKVSALSSQQGSSRAASTTLSNEVFILDMGHWKWKRIKAPKAASRQRTATASANDDASIIGEQKDNEGDDEDDDAAVVWPARRHSHACCLSPTGESMFIHGGEGSHGTLSDLWEFNFGKKQWRRIDVISDEWSFGAGLERSRHALVFAGEQLALIGGMQQTTTAVGTGGGGGGADLNSLVLVMESFLGQRQQQVQRSEESGSGEAAQRAQQQQPEQEEEEVVVYHRWRPFKAAGTGTGLGNGGFGGCTLPQWNGFYFCFGGVTHATVGGDLARALLATAPPERSPLDEISRRMARLNALRSEKFHSGGGGRSGACPCDTELIIGEHTVGGEGGDLQQQQQPIVLPLHLAIIAARAPLLAKEIAESAVDRTRRVGGVTVRTRVVAGNRRVQGLSAAASSGGPLSPAPSKEAWRALVDYLYTGRIAPAAAVVASAATNSLDFDAASAAPPSSSSSDGGMAAAAQLLAPLASHYRISHLTQYLATVSDDVRSQLPPSVLASLPPVAQLSPGARRAVADDIGAKLLVDSLYDLYLSGDYGDCTLRFSDLHSSPASATSFNDAANTGNNSSASAANPKEESTALHAAILMNASPMLAQALRHVVRDNRTPFYDDASLGGGGGVVRVSQKGDDPNRPTSAQHFTVDGLRVPTGAPLRICLKHIYTGQVEGITPLNALEVTMCADMLQLEHLKTAAEFVLCAQSTASVVQQQQQQDAGSAQQQPQQQSPEMLVDLLHLASRYKCEKILDVLSVSAAGRFDAVRHVPGYLELPAAVRQDVAAMAGMRLRHTVVRSSQGGAGPTVLQDRDQYQRRAASAQFAL